MTDVLLLTGFLGAGKTTVMNALLGELSGETVALIVNEYGRQAVDDALLADRLRMMRGLAGGSIFCACLKHQFFDAFDEMLDGGFSHLLIEASGLSDPSSMKLVVDQLDLARDRVRTLRVASVVDAVNFIKLSPVLPVLTRQVEYSDLIILNKAAAVPQTEEAAVRAAIDRLLPGACVLDFDRHRPGELYQTILQSPARSYMGEASTNTRFSREKAALVCFEHPVEPETLRRFLEAVSPLAYRIKGFCRTPVGAVLISGVNGSVSVEPWDQPLRDDQCYLTVIALKGLGFMAKIGQFAKALGIEVGIES